MTRKFLILLDFVVGLFFTQTVHEFSRIHEWEGFNSSIRGLFADGFRAKPQIPLEPGKFKRPDYEATLKAPIKLEEALPAHHLARFVVDITAQLDLNKIYAGYAGQGG